MLIVLEKITIKKIVVFSDKEFSKKNENDPCQVVYFCEKKLYAVLEHFYCFFVKLYLLGLLK